MNRIIAMTGLVLGAASFSALAATPSSGTLTLESGPVEFSNGPNIGVNPTPQAEATCLDPVLACDHFDLTIDLPENIGEYFPQALIRMTFAWDDPAGLAQEDYDIYVYDLAGNEVNSAATANNPELMVQLALGGVFDYTFDIVYYSVVASTYTGTIELELGEPAEDKDPEEFFASNSVLGAALKPQQESNTTPERSAYVERRSAGGAFGLGSLMAAFGLLALRRRIK